MTDPRRRIPSIERLLESEPVRRLSGLASRDRVAALLRSIQDEVRSAVDRAGGPADPGDEAWYAGRLRERLTVEAEPSLRRVINATGVVLHTNLGRAPLADRARDAVAAAAGYASLEYDLDSGERGSRHDHCADLLRELTGAEAALVVNNNAAAVVLALNTLADGREAVVSRGELVEIGGSFRVPEIMARSGARMREVGSTNRTHPGDYAAAIGPETGAVLKVHRSNFRVEGFTAEVSPAELVGVASEAGVPVVADQGSGLLVDLSRTGLPPEPTARDLIEAGADIVTMSGDKLLGGPQAGLIVGRADLVGRMRSNPLCRALRPDKLTLAALEATLVLYRDPERAFVDIPVLRMLSLTPSELEARAESLARALAAEDVEADVVPARSTVGGGAYPGAELATFAVAIDPVGGGGPDRLAAALRSLRPPVIGRIHEGRLLLDPRTVDPADESDLVRVVAEALGSAGAGP